MRGHPTDRRTNEASYRDVHEFIASDIIDFYQFSLIFIDFRLFTLIFMFEQKHQEAMDLQMDKKRFGQFHKKRSRKLDLNYFYLLNK